MNNIYIKKYWPEEDIMFYIHFQNGEAIAQIEITEGKKIFLSKASPFQGDSMLYDQSLDQLELEDGDYISEKEFMVIWNDQ